MNILSFFKKKTEYEKEQEYEQEVIDNNLAEYLSTITAKVIMYTLKEDDEIPVIINICDFHASVLPSPNSIIWAANEKQQKIVPYKVIRYDFIEDVETNTYTYIVVVPARLTDVTDINIF